MDYYKRKMFATTKIRRMYASGIPLEKMFLIILEEYGLGENFIKKTYEMLVKEEIGAGEWNKLKINTLK